MLNEINMMISSHELIFELQKKSISLELSFHGYLGKNFWG